jgi:beta-N-acetylhexosaminidase
MLEATPQCPVVIDVAGVALDATDRSRLKHPLTGGLVLFARNFESRAQLVELTSEIKSLRPDVLITVDQEGGRVQRFQRDGFTHLPAMRTLGELWMQDPMAALGASRACGYVMGSELRACGVDLSFAPVLDLDTGSVPLVGDRTLHRDPRVVSLLAQSLAHGLLQAGMQACGKHFPGHGHAAVNSRQELPVDRRSLKALLTDDTAPYRWLAGALAALMPAHVAYPKIDARPAGFSRRWLHDILREELGFSGAVFSNDLAGPGASQLDGCPVSMTEAAVAALQAGCDLVLLCHESIRHGGAAIDALLSGLQAAHASGSWHPNADSETRRLSLLPRLEPLAWDELMLQPNYLNALEQLPHG